MGCNIERRGGMEMRARLIFREGKFSSEDVLEFLVFLLEFENWEFFVELGFAIW